MPDVANLDLPGIQRAALDHELDQLEKDLHKMEGFISRYEAILKSLWKEIELLDSSLRTN